MEDKSILGSNLNNLKIVNIGILNFYESLTAQDAVVVQVNWRPPKEKDKETESILDKIL